MFRITATATVVVVANFCGLAHAQSTGSAAISPADKQARATQAADAIRKLSPLPDPNMTMRGIVEVQHGDKIAFCGEILGEEFPVHYAGFVRFISYDGKAALESPSAAFTEQERFARAWNSLCEPQ